MSISKVSATTIPNRIAQDANLSYAALGLYVYMRSHPEDEFYKHNIYRAGTGLKGMQNLIKELENAGLLVQE